MISEYLYEIIGIIVVLTAIVIYFLTRRFYQKEQEDLEYPNTKPFKADKPAKIKPLKIDEFEDETEDGDQVNFILETQNEGSFGDIDTNPFESSSEEKQINEELQSRELQSTETNPIQKIEVPAHGKITKENFKDFAGVNLLVVEDNIINQKVISGLLAKSGIEITMADNGQIALDILENNSDFNMILMDAHMPVLDGFETTRKIKENPKYNHVVIVALSGDTAIDDIRKMTEAGMQEHLEKPLKMDSFYDILYAYTKVNNTNIQEQTIDVIMTQELQGDKGLAICGGDEAFYRDILSEFTTTYSDAANQLLEFLEKKDIKTADAFLLDFVGITANIGAENIRNIALEIKEAMKDDEEQSYVTTIDDFATHLEKLLKDIEAYNK